MNVNKYNINERECLTKMSEGWWWWWWDKTNKTNTQIENYYHKLQCPLDRQPTNTVLRLTQNTSVQHRCRGKSSGVGSVMIATSAHQQTSKSVNRQNRRSRLRIFRRLLTKYNHTQRKCRTNQRNSSSRLQMLTKPQTAVYLAILRRTRRHSRNSDKWTWRHTDIHAALNLRSFNTPYYDCSG